MVLHYHVVASFMLLCVGWFQHVLHHCMLVVSLPLILGQPILPGGPPQSRFQAQPQRGSAAPGSFANLPFPDTETLRAQMAGLELPPGVCMSYHTFQLIDHVCHYANI